MHGILAKFGALAIAPSLFFGGWWGHHVDNATKHQTPRADNEYRSALSISTVDGPDSLAVDEDGTWTIAVKAKDNTNLHYAVTWGDEATATTMRTMALVDATSTFTHAYASAGTYKPEFTVTDDNGHSVTKSAKVVVGTTTNLTLTSVAPTSGAVGASVTAYGTGIADGDTVTVGGVAATDVVVNGDDSVTFTVPSLKTGTYNVRVHDGDTRSNPVPFKVVAKSAVISINGLDAPVSLTAGEEGTWKVNVGTSASNLHYAVTWGDEGSSLLRMFAANSTIQTSSTFTHTYETEGTYTPKFTVTDDYGHSASVSSTVLVKASDE